MPRIRSRCLRPDPAGELPRIEAGRRGCGLAAKPDGVQSTPNTVFARALALCRARRLGSADLAGRSPHSKRIQRLIGARGCAAAGAAVPPKVTTLLGSCPFGFQAWLSLSEVELSSWVGPGDARPHAVARIVSHLSTLVYVEICLTSRRNSPCPARLTHAGAARGRCTMPRASQALTSCA